MASSRSWRAFLDHLREITQLIRADPTSAYSERREDGRQANVELSSAITKAAMSLTSGRLQGCLSSQVQEFLERLDSSGIVVDQIPEVLRAHLVLRFPKAKPEEENVAHAIALQKANAPLWTSGTVIKPGTIKTSSLPDSIWNPRPKRVQALLRRCDVDLFAEIEAKHGTGYLGDLKTNVENLVEFRNEVAHGDEPQPVGTAEVWRSIRWAARLARAADDALASKLMEITGEAAW